MRFVVADDMHTPRAILARILRDAGHEVVAEAKDGLEAVRLCKEHQPDAVILDISMPHLTGDRAARMIHADQTARYIFIASSISSHDVRKPLEAETGAHFVVKPFRAEQLVAALHQVLPQG